MKVVELGIDDVIGRIVDYNLRLTVRTVVNWYDLYYGLQILISFLCTIDSVLDPEDIVIAKLIRN